MCAGAGGGEGAGGSPGSTPRKLAKLQTQANQARANHERVKKWTKVGHTRELCGGLQA